MTSTIYVRVSTDEQAKEGRSIQDQISICRKYAKEKNYNVLKVFKDEGRSGSDSNRPGLLDMITFCQKNKIDRVLILDTDRLARREDIHFSIKAILKKVNTSVESVNQPMIDSSPEGQLLDSVLAALNAFYPKLTGRKTIETLMEKAQAGWYPGPAPLGYINVLNESSTDKINKRTIAVDPEKSHLVINIFKYYATGLYNTNDLSEKMYQEGLRSKHDKKVKASEICKIIRSEFYIGKLKHKGVTYEGKHKPLIDVDLFKRCQATIDKHNDYAERKRKHSFLLSGLIHCAICGRLYTAEKHIKKNVIYYHCLSTKNVHSNKKQNVSANELEKYIAGLFKKIVLPREVIDGVISEARKRLLNMHGNIDNQRRILALQVQKLEDRKQTLEKKLLDGVVSDETYTRQYKLIKESEKQIDSQTLELAEDRKANLVVFEKLATLGHSIYKAYLKADTNQKKALIRLFWDQILVKDRQIKKAVPSKGYEAVLSSKDAIASLNLTGSVINLCKWGG